MRHLCRELIYLVYSQSDHRCKHVNHAKMSHRSRVAFLIRDSKTQPFLHRVLNDGLIVAPNTQGPSYNDELPEMVGIMIHDE